MIVGDNGAIYRIVGTNGISSGAFLKFQYDNYGALKVIPRSVKLLDYTLGGTSSDIGAGDLVHGEAGDDMHAEARETILSLAKGRMTTCPARLATTGFQAAQGKTE